MWRPAWRRCQGEIVCDAVSVGVLGDRVQRAPNTKWGVGCKDTRRNSMGPGDCCHPRWGAGEGAACCQNPEGRLYERNSGRGGPHREGLGVNTFPLHQQPVT